MALILGSKNSFSQTLVSSSVSTTATTARCRCGGAGVDGVDGAGVDVEVEYPPPVAGVVVVDGVAGVVDGALVGVVE